MAAPMSDPTPITYKTRRAWNSTRHDWRRVRHTGEPSYSAGYYAHREPAVTHTERLEADFTIELDIPGLIAEAVSRCASTKGGRAVIAGGLVKVRRGPVSVLSSASEEKPLREGYELAPEAGR